ncbi:MAG: hypothetical protein ABMA64_33350 [Myxococcota bacterium]
MKRRDGHESEDTETLLYGSAAPDEAPPPTDDFRFDYASFENTMGQYRAAEIGPRGATSDGVQKRRTIDDQSFPKDDAVYDIRQVGKYQVLTIRGQLNESFPGRAIGSQLHGPTVFDLTEVDRVTSFGVRAWLELLDVARGHTAVFLRASPAVVNQITMMRNFCGTARIHSLVAPYACPRCGSGFGVPFDAIEDRAILRARNPPRVVCPDCRGAAEMDEDPWVYFDLDDQLIDSVDAELARVLAQLGDAPRRPPVEKSIAGDLTRVRINGVVNGTTRLQRAFSGLEGKVVLDLRSLAEIDSPGVDNLAGCLVRVPDEVQRLVIEGAPLSLLRRLLDDRPQRVFVGSVVTSVKSLTRPLRRRLCIDLKVHRASLAERVVPELDLPWRGDPMELEGQELVAEALKLLPPGSTTPAPVHRTSPSSSASIAPILVPAPIAVPAVPTRRTPVPSSPPQPSRTWVWLLTFAVALFGLALVGTVALVIAVTSTRGVEVPVGLDPVGRPAWAEIELAETAGRLLLVGQGEGPDEAAARDAARDHALDTLLQLAARESELPFPDERLPAEGAEREAALQFWRGATSDLALQPLQEVAQRTSSGGYLVLAQFGVDRTALAEFGSRYTQQLSFRGITVSPRAPWVEPGLRLVRRESYIRSVEPGDRLRRVGNVGVTTLTELQAAAEQQYVTLPEGESLEFVFDRGGQQVVASVFKPVTRRAPDPNQGNRPTLFRRD